MATKIKPPHLLAIGVNPRKVMQNLSRVLPQPELDKIEAELRSNVGALYALAAEHHGFALAAQPSRWRQRISRLYYGAYNARRALMLQVDGSFSTESNDHKDTGHLPDDFPDVAIYRVKLPNLREDRNLADYSHLAQETDLADAVADYEALVTNFMTEVRTYLAAKGVVV